MPHKLKTFIPKDRDRFKIISTLLNYLKKKTFATIYFAKSNK